MAGTLSRLRTKAWAFIGYSICTEEYDTMALRSSQ
jgi:hypothetical protein